MLGAVFGLRVGWPLACLLTALGSSLAFLIGQYILKPILLYMAPSRVEQLRLRIEAALGPDNNTVNGSISSTNTSTSTSTSTSNSTTSTSGNESIMDVEGEGEEKEKEEMVEGVIKKSADYMAVEDDNIAAAAKSPTASSSSSSSSFSSSAAAASTIRTTGAAASATTSAGSIDLLVAMIGLRMFPLTPQWFVNMASPALGIPLHVHFFSMLIGVAPYNFLCVQAGTIVSQIDSLQDVLSPMIVLQLMVISLVVMGLGLARRRLVGDRKKKTH